MTVIEYHSLKKIWAWPRFQQVTFHDKFNYSVFLNIFFTGLAFNEMGSRILSNIEEEKEVETILFENGDDVIIKESNGHVESFKGDNLPNDGTVDIWLKFERNLLIVNYYFPIIS